MSVTKEEEGKEEERENANKCAAAAEKSEI